MQTFVNASANIFTTRGSFTPAYGKVGTSTFDLQDAYDFKSHGHDNVHEEGKSTDTSAKDRAVTSKSNWLFWIKMDTLKLLQRPVKIETPQFVLAPPLEVYIPRLEAITDRTITIDIEVNMEAGKIDCIGITVDDSPVVVFPIYSYTHELYYKRATTLRFLAALSRAMLRNIVVAHNSMFDLVYLMSELRLNIGHRIYDTMIAQQRCFAEVEKSLGHAISLWTWQPWHKGEGGGAHSQAGQLRYWEYNAKDVWCTRMVHRDQVEWASARPAFVQSIAQANDSIYPYIIMTTTGCRISRQRLAVFKSQLTARVKQLERVLRCLTGVKALNPNSVDQLRKFFYGALYYKPPSYTDTGKPALGEKQIYQLALKYPNPVLQILLQYRELSKELSMASMQSYCFYWQRERELEIL
jgi:hypothetical protein